MEKIKHIWFDFSDTIVKFDEKIHDTMVYEAYSSLIGKPVTPELKEEFSSLFKKHKSYSKTFTQLGKESTYWSDKIHSANPRELMRLIDKDAPGVFNALKEILPISVWSNIRVREVLPVFDINPDWFTHILGPDEVKKPKPSLDGFHLLIERSEMRPEHILFVGDSLDKEIRPAHSLGIQTGLIWSSSPEANYCFGGFQEILELVK